MNCFTKCLRALFCKYGQYADEEQLHVLTDAAREEKEITSRSQLHVVVVQLHNKIELKVFLILHITANSDIGNRIKICRYFHESEYIGRSLDKFSPKISPLQETLLNLQGPSSRANFQLRVYKH